MLGQMSIACEVIAPALIPRKPGERINLTGATLPSLLGSTALASSPPSASRPRRKRLSATSSAPARMFARTSSPRTTASPSPPSAPSHTLRREELDNRHLRWLRTQSFDQAGETTTLRALPARPPHRPPRQARGRALCSGCRRALSRPGGTPLLPARHLRPQNATPTVQKRPWGLRRTIWKAAYLSVTVSISATAAARLRRRLPGPSAAGPGRCPRASRPACR